MAEKTPSSRFGDDWPGKAVDFIDLVVNTINDRVIRPIILIGRAIVFGLLIAVLVVVVAVVVAVAVVRLLDVYAFANHVWISYAILGVVFSLIGLFAWTKRSPSQRDAGDA